MTAGAATARDPVAGEVDAGPRPLAAYRRDVYSQFGEDGIIEEIFRRLGVDVTRPVARGGLWCVELGAWDGVHLSNTRKLVEDAGAAAVLIEPDAKRHAALVRNCARFDDVITMRRAVGWEGPDRLDALLAETPCPRDLDLLSIDVDGHDYHLWRRLEDHRPTVVVIEFNPTIPFETVYTPPDDPARRHGCSLAAIVQLAERKGYRLVAVTEVNAILVVEERADALGLGRPALADLTAGLTDFTSYLFQTFDGELVVGGNRMYMWHQVLFDKRSIQALPKLLRRHPEDLGPIGRATLALLRRWRSARHARRKTRAARPG